MIIRPVGAELFHADGQTDRPTARDEANWRSSLFLQRAPQKKQCTYIETLWPLTVVAMETQQCVLVHCWAIFHCQQYWKLWVLHNDALRRINVSGNNKTYVYGLM